MRQASTALYECRDCRVVKPPDAFYEADPRLCKSCKKIRQDTYVKANPDKVRVWKQRYTAKNYEAIRDAQRRRAKEYRNTATGKAAIAEWNARNADRRRDYQRKQRARRRWVTIEKQYGLTRQGYEALHRAQGMACAICCRPFPADIETHRADGSGRSLVHIDHCHLTGQVRGLLCPSCNRALGLLQDNPAAALSAAKYLLRGGANNVDAASDFC